MEVLLDRDHIFSYMYDNFIIVYCWVRYMKLALRQLWISMEHHKKISIKALPDRGSLLFKLDISEKLILAMGPRHDQDLNPGSHGLKLSAPPLSYPLIPHAH